MEPIRLMLVDDHDLLRTSLKLFLNTQKGLSVVAEARHVQDALRLAQEVHPDVVLMEINVPGFDGLEVTRRLRLINPECKILALTTHSDKHFFLEMLATGVTGYITKDGGAEELVVAIRSIAAGQVYLPPAMIACLVEEFRKLRQQEKTSSVSDDSTHTSIINELDVLSDREIQVLALVAEGLTNPEIGQGLGISPKTVARHRERIMDKLDVHSTTELVKFAIRTGLIHLS
jgi:DNA-binding NarL/FixJ family response regulator